MNARNDIEQYLRPGKFRFMVGVVGCIIAVVLGLLGGLINAGIIGATSKTDAVPFGAMSSVQEGKYAYVDVVGLDEWSARSDDKYMYVCVDKDGQLSILCMKPSDESKFSSQKEYWARHTKDGTTATVPSPIRVYGTVTKMPSNLISVLSSTYGISSTTLTNKVGTFYLNTMVTAKDSLSSPLFAVAIASAIVGIISLVSYFSHVKTIRTCLDRLDAEGFTQKAWDELKVCLKDSAMVPGLPGMSLSENFIISRRDGAIMAYTDILWIYRHVVRRNFVVTGRSLVCRLTGSQTVNLGLKTRKKSSEEVIQLIFTAVDTKNPTVLIGFTPENSQRYEEMVRQA